MWRENFFIFSPQKDAVVLFNPSPRNFTCNLMTTNVLRLCEIFCFVPESTLFLFFLVDTWKTGDFSKQTTQLRDFFVFGIKRMVYDTTVIFFFNFFKWLAFNCDTTFLFLSTSTGKFHKHQAVNWKKWIIWSSKFHVNVKLHKKPCKLVAA